MPLADSITFTNSLGYTFLLSNNYVEDMMSASDRNSGTNLDSDKNIMFYKIAPVRVLIIDMTSSFNRALLDKYTIAHDLSLALASYPFQLKFTDKSTSALANISAALQSIQWTGRYPILDLSQIFVVMSSPDIFVFATKPIESPMQPFIHVAWQGNQEWWLNSGVDTTLGLDVIKKQRGDTITVLLNPALQDTCGQITLTTPGVYHVSAHWLLETGTSTTAVYATSTINITGVARISSIENYFKPGGKISGTIFVDYSDLPATLILTINQINSSSTNWSLKKKADFARTDEFCWMTVAHLS